MKKHPPLRRIPNPVKIIPLFFQRLTLEQPIHPPASLDQVHQAAEVAQESFVPALVNNAVLNRLGAAAPVRQGRRAQVALQEREYFQPISGLLQSQESEKIIQLQTANCRALQFQ